jgi:hypothetical protein
LSRNALRAFAARRWISREVRSTTTAPIAEESHLPRQECVAKSWMGCTSIGKVRSAKNKLAQPKEPIRRED